jgi:hypothetical protein
VPGQPHRFSSFVTVAAHRRTPSTSCPPALPCPTSVQSASAWSTSPVARSLSWVEGTVIAPFATMR